MVPPYSHRVSRVRRYSGYNRLTLVFAYETVTLFGEPSHVLLLTFVNTLRCPNPTNISTRGLASSAFARHYLRNLCWFLFLALLRCFSSGGSPPYAMNSRTVDTHNVPGCPIQWSPDITLMCSSPRLIAAYHDFHRLLMPRHSPCALFSLTSFEVTTHFKL